MAEGSWIRVNAVDAHLDARTVNSIIKEVLGKKAKSITQMPELRQKIGEAYLRAVTPFVPMKTGALRESGRATSDGRLYWTAVAPAHGDDGYDFNYASTVYDQDSVRWGPEGYDDPTTEGTHPRWVEQVQPGTEAYTGFIAEVTDLVRKEFADDE